MSLAKTSRSLHRWGAVLTALPLLVIIATGLLLQLKKEWAWVQPPTQRGAGTELSLTWDGILEAARAVPEAGIASWDDVNRLDVRPGRGLIKVRAANRWELQLDAATGAVLSSTYRRSDLIESLHDGSWFHATAKLWIWLPTAVVLFGLWLSGLYLWYRPHGLRRRRDHAAREAASA